MLDAGAFYAGTPFLSASARLYVTSAVLDEVRHIKSSVSALQALIDAKRLVVQDPEQKHVDRVLDTAIETGDRTQLSTADISVISLALQLGTLLVTDDYSVANVASALGIVVKPATAGKEIKETRKTIYYCSGCSRSFAAGRLICPFCGNKLRRKFRSLRRNS